MITINCLQFLDMPSEFIYRTIRMAAFRAKHESEKIVIENSREFCKLCESEATSKHLAAWIAYNLALEHLNVDSFDFESNDNRKCPHISENVNNRETAFTNNDNNIPEQQYLNSSNSLFQYLSTDMLTNITKAYNELVEMVSFHEQNKNCNENENNIANSMGTFTSLFETLSIQPSLSSSMQVLQLLPTGILICGSGGSGKSSLLKLLLRKTQPFLTCLELTTTTLIQKEVGVSERRLQEMFTHSKQIAQESNSNTINTKNTVVLLLIDDLDRFFPVDMSHCPSVTKRLLDVFLAQTESLAGSGVVLVGTSQSTRHIHPALLRHGRFEELLFLNKT